MSNFYCEYCGMVILEDDEGNYYTECEHYPLEEENMHQTKREVDKYFREKFCLPGLSIEDKTEGEE